MARGGGRGALPRRPPTLFPLPHLHSLRRLAAARTSLDAQATASDTARRSVAGELADATALLASARRDLDAVHRRARVLRVKLEGAVEREEGGG